MRVIATSGLPWKTDHPTGSLSFRYLLTGEDGAADNFVLILARQNGHFATERHRHNFDQFRFPLRGDMNVGKGIVLRAGQLGYFTEGAPYGPQDDPPEEGRLHLTLQFGGASGFGYLGPDHLRRCRDELRREGEFVDVFYRGHDGRTQNGLDAVWQHAFGTRLRYPKPRYSGPVIMDPRSFRPVAVPHQDGVSRKHLGSFTERGTWAEIVALESGAQWTSCDHAARRLLFVLTGEGACGEAPFTAHTAVQIEPGETATLTASSASEMLLMGLPAVAAALADDPAAADLAEAAAE